MNHFDDVETSFRLEPIAVRGRRVRCCQRRRRQVVDRERTLSSKQLQKNFKTANDRLIRELEIPSLLFESAETMLSRFGLRTAAHGSKRLWHNRKTFPEPDDLSSFHIFTKKEPGVPKFLVPPARPAKQISVESTGFSVSLFGPRHNKKLKVRGLQGGQLRGKPRAKELKDDTHGFSTSASKTMPSVFCCGTSQNIRDHSSATERFLTVPDITNSDLSGEEDVKSFEDIVAEALVPETVRELQTLIYELEVVLDLRTEYEEEKDVSDTGRKKACIVSPEKMPLLSPTEKRISPRIGHVMEYLKLAFEESDVSTLASFTSVIKKSPGTKKYIAKLFKLILDLHDTSVIFIIQLEHPVPGERKGEILINKGPNFRGS